MAGYGECVAMENPFYNHETIDTAWLMTTNYIVPLLEAARFSRRRRYATRLPRFGEPDGESRGRGGDLGSRSQTGRTTVVAIFGGTQAEITCGVSIGLQDSTEALLEQVSRELESGYQRIKLKIKPGKDALLVEAVRGRFPEITLSVDANSAYSLVTDARSLRDSTISAC